MTTLASVAGIGGVGVVSASTRTTGADSAAEGEKPFRVGLIVELTGNLGFLGQSSERAIEVALDQINAEPGRQIEIVTCDTESRPEVAQSCYDRLVDRDEVDALIGPGLTSNAEAIAPKTDEDQILNYVLGGSYGQYDMNGHRYQFGAHAVTEDVMAAMWRWGMAREYETAYMISSADATGEACRRFFDDDAWAGQRAGIELVGEAEMDITAQTAAPQMAGVANDADMLVLCVAGNAGVVAMASYAQSGLTMPALTMHSNGVPFVAEALQGRVENDTVYVPSFCVLPAVEGELEGGYACSERANQFAAAFSERFPDETADILGAAAFDGIMQIAEAVRFTDGSSDAMVEWFESQDAWVGAAGVYSYSEDRHRGLGSESVLMGVFKDGAWHLDSMLDVPLS